MSDDQTFDDDQYEGDAHEPGYTDHEWDTLDPAEVALHDSILEMSRDELAALDLSALTDLQLWAAAQAYADLDEEDELFAQFEGVCRRIVGSRKAHPAIDYGEIGLELLNTFLVFERFADARSFLPEVARHIPSDSFIEERYLAMILILEGNDDAGFEKIQALIDKAEEQGDAYLLYAIAEDLITISAPEDAEAVLDKVEELAGNENDEELLALVEDARSAIEEIYAADEAGDQN